MSISDTFGSEFLDANFFAADPFDAEIFRTGFLRPAGFGPHVSGPQAFGPQAGDDVELTAAARLLSDELGLALDDAPAAPPERRAAPSAIVLRPSESTEIAAQLLRPTPQIVVAAGAPGSGRSAIVGDVAAALRGAANPLHLRRTCDDPAIDPSTDLVSAVGDLIDEGLAASDVLVLDDFDKAAEPGPHQVSSPLLTQVMFAHRHSRIQFLLIVDEAALHRLNELNPEFAAVARVVTLGALPRTAVRAIVEEVAAERAELPVDPDVVSAALGPADPGTRRRHPGLAIDRIDAAIGRARAGQAETLRAPHLALPAAGLTSAADLWLALSTQVRGQPRAVATVAAHLAPALAHLKPRPERPHGVFLFTGPSGVGKTELAKQVARTVYGGEEALIRLDMSEYGNLDDARMKLIGAHRTWRNSTAEGLLTTRVIHRPRSVILLDEFEKAHPDLWPLFLQVFDEGRLSDGWGQTAAFADTVLIMTTNLAAPEEKFPPEFRNRLTATVDFTALALAHLREIAELELSRTATRLADHGWHITYADDVAAHLAAVSVDPEFGARRLQRVMDVELFRLLNTADVRRVRVVVDGDHLAVVPNPLR
ncbi:AAA family ATPase [Gordonia phosphorivorans]|uniref:Uncharacterized protein n=2 Tax=Gordonia TaxID=2053 RepID=A0ABP8ZCW5_9ACTN